MARRLTSLVIPLVCVLFLALGSLGLLPASVAASQSGEALAPDPYEADNSPDAAFNVALGESQQHTIAPLGDEDWVRFVPPEMGQAYVLRVERSTLALTVEIWTRSGLAPVTRLATIQVRAGGAADVLELTPADGNGTYLARVAAAERSGVGSYEISIRVKRAPLATAAAPTPSLPATTEAAPAAPSPAPDAEELAPGTTRARKTDGTVMIYVPGGEFLMGSTGAQVEDAFKGCQTFYQDCQRDWFAPEAPQHTVSLDAFWIDRTEVTNARFRMCAEAGQCRAPTTCSGGEPTYGDASKTDHPVVCVDWDQAVAYCRWAGARLPTEAEWEKVARGTQGRAYPWGDAFNGSRANFCDKNCELGWKDASGDDGYARTAPVGSFLAGASPYGALDMTGNVWEWVADGFAAGATGQSPERSPTRAADSGQYRVVRGGSWGDNLNFVRAADRLTVESTTANYSLGFRCSVSSMSSQTAMTATQTPSPTATPAVADTPVPTATPKPETRSTQPPLTAEPAATPVSTAPVTGTAEVTAPLTLLAPPDGETFGGLWSNITFSWSPAPQPLANDEYYVLVITHSQGKDYVWAKEPTFQAGEEHRWWADYGPPLHWQVVIARQRTGEPGEDPTGAEVNPYSETRVVYWNK